MALTKVSTDGVKDDAITKTKIPANQIEASELADNAVDTNAIADQAVALSKLPHGDGSSDGKFLRANNGADPSFETITGTTINNNADNRVITGSGTANTLEGESNLTFDGSTLIIGANAPKLKFNELNDNPDYFINANAGELNIHDDTNSSTKLTITATKTVFPNNNVGIGTTSPSAKLHVDTSHYVPTSSGKSTTGIHLDGNPGNAGEYGGGISFGCGNSSGSAAAIAARQGTSDSDVIGMSFFTHDSSTGTADAVEKVRIHDGGAVSFNNGIILGNGLGYDSNHLMNDYEEGSWTPVIASGSGSLNVFKATYTKIGRSVFIQFYFSINGTGSNGNNAIFTGLPFTVQSSGWTAAQINTGYSNPGIHCRCNQSSTQIDIKTTADTAITFANLNGTWILSGIHYHTDA